MDYKNYHITIMEKIATLRIFTCDKFGNVENYLNTHTVFS
jgi:hypothetical protein